MSARTLDVGSGTPLRQQAEAKLIGGIAPAIRRSAPSAQALTILFNLASAPESAGDALKMLHELQVHQVELDLQHEQLERTQAELTATLDRYVGLFDFAPVGYFAIDGDGRILEGNRAGADLFGVEQHQLPGRRIDSFLSPDNRLTVAALLARVRTSGGKETCDVRYQGSDAVSRTLRMVARASPHGESILLALTDT